MNRILIKNATIINEGKKFNGSVLIDNQIIAAIFTAEIPAEIPAKILDNAQIIDATGLYLFPGVIDDQVHFREPGLTYKAEIYTEAKAAVAGGVTSFMEMPNTHPQTVTQQLLDEKYILGKEKSLANYSFYMGATNSNLEELLRTDPKTVCGIKIFMGSSTGNMLVDNAEVLEQIFEKSNILIAVHCEDEEIIRNNLSNFKAQLGEDISIHQHPLIRSAEACYKSSSFAVKLAQKHNTRLHILHLSSAKELDLLDNTLPSKDKRITAEVCVHHLFFDDRDYSKYGNRIKWNPAIKTQNDKNALLQGLIDGKLDVIATDHAPHTLEEKEKPYMKAPSGGPLVQHSLVAMLELYHQKKISIEMIINKLCHAPADIFKIDKRGYIKEGYWADLVLVDLNSPWTVSKNNLFYKCQWSPFEGVTFQSKITHTFINGHLAYHNGVFDESKKGERLSFNR